MNKEDFINLVANSVCYENKKRGYPLFSSVVIAQAILETGYGSSGLMMKANAVFGIKATLNWKGKVYNSITKEVYSGTTVNINACFRAYDSISASISDYFDLICTLDRYREALLATTPKEQITLIKRGGYATDPEYVNKIMSIINSNNLTRFDKEISSEDIEYVIGKNYELQANMFVRTGAGTNFQIKAWQELTEDGKRHAVVQEYGANAVLKKGTIVTCKNVIHEGINIWLQIPSGYVAGYHNGEVYAK